MKLPIPDCSQYPVPEGQVKEVLTCLKEAKARIEDFRDNYICIAVGCSDHSDSAKAHTTAWVQAQIEPCSAYGGWAFEKLNEDNLGAAEFVDNRTGRLAWLDSMITHLEAYHA